MTTVQSKGYRPAFRDSDTVRRVATDIAAVDQLRDEIFHEVNALDSRRVTRQELRRDYGFTPCGLRLLERLGWLQADSVDGARRKTFNLKEALRARLLYPDVACARGIRLRRKRDRITTILRDLVWRSLSGCNTSE